MLPEARRERLLVHQLGDELVVYDRDRHRAHRLNRAASLVWRRCDGRTSVAQLALLLQTELGLPASEVPAWLALDGLDRAHLLRERLERPPETRGVTRREVVRRLGLASALALLLPVVTSVVAPTPAMAQYAVRCDCVNVIPPPPFPDCHPVGRRFNGTLPGVCVGAGTQCREQQCVIRFRFTCTQGGWSQDFTRHDCP